MITQNRHWWLVAGGVLLGLWLSGCTQKDTNPAANGKPNVVATSTIIADLTDEIGGDEIQIRGILKPGTDPHVYEPVPADSVALEKANLILYNGYNLEPGLIKLMNAAGLKARKVAVGEVAKPLQLDKKAKECQIPMFGVMLRMLFLWSMLFGMR